MYSLEDYQRRISRDQNRQYWRSFNVHIARYLQSRDAAIVLADIVHQYEYFEEKNKLVSNPKHGPGWVFYTVRNMDYRLFMNQVEQEEALAILVKFGLIEFLTFGLPRRRYFRIIDEKIAMAAIEGSKIPLRNYNSKNKKIKDTESKVVKKLKKSEKITSEKHVLKNKKIQTPEYKVVTTEKKSEKPVNLIARKIHTVENKAVTKLKKFIRLYEKDNQLYLTNPAASFLGENENKQVYFTISRADFPEENQNKLLLKALPYIYKTRISKEEYIKENTQVYERKKIPPNPQRGLSSPDGSDAPANADAHTCFSENSVLAGEKKKAGRPRKPEKPVDPSKVPRADGVSTTPEEHDKLVEKFGKDMTQKGYEELSLWKKSALPSQVKKHSSDYLRIRKWVIPQILEEDHKYKTLKSKSVDPGRVGKAYVIEADFKSEIVEKESL